MLDNDFDDIDYESLDQKALRRSRYILSGLSNPELPPYLVTEIHQWLYLTRNRKETQVALWEFYKKNVLPDE